MSSKKYYENEVQQIVFRSISKDDARDQIKRYITQHPGSLTSQIIEALRVDPITTVDVLNELKHEGSVQSRAV